MARAVRALAIGAVALLGTCCATVAGEQPADALARVLAGIQGAERGAVIPLANAALARALPQQQFYVLRFRQYPVAGPVPTSLGANNLFVVKDDASVEHFTSAEALEAFFRATLAPVTKETEAREALEAWLRLAQEFHQDGFFEFSIPDDSLEVTSTGGGGLLATGKAVVAPRGGNAGELVASLTFDRAGTLVKVSQAESVRRGLRPICQATKLLDPDPVVRAMAEQQLLIMGRAAKAYLDARRAGASPELHRAIDEIWQRILAEGR